MTGDLSAFAQNLPKSELHVHLEGTLEPELAFALAQRNGIPLDVSTAAEMRAGFTFHDLASFLAIYYPAMRVLLTADDFHDLAWAYLQRAAGDGVRHVEMFFDPQAHTSRGVPMATIIGGYRRAAVRARQELGISAELILCFLRDMTPEHAMSTLVEALPYRDALLGVGLDSDERGNPPTKFAAVFGKAREAGLFVTVHCDIDQENSIEHIRSALFELEVDRIDHGTNIVEDGALVDEVIRRGIGLTTCPISNSFVTKTMKADEIVSLFRRGVAITVNSDDPAYFGGYVAANYVALAEQANLTAADLAGLAINSFRASWLPAREVERLTQSVRDYAAEHGVTLD